MNYYRHPPPAAVQHTAAVNSAFKTRALLPCPRTRNHGQLVRAPAIMEATAASDVIGLSAAPVAGAIPTPWR